MSQTTKFNSMTDSLQQKTNVITPYFEAKVGGDIYIFKGCITCTTIIIVHKDLKDIQGPIQTTCIPQSITASILLSVRIQMSHLCSFYVSTFWLTVLDCFY